MTSMRVFIDCVTESMSFVTQPQGPDRAAPRPGAAAAATMKWYKEKNLAKGTAIWHADITLPSTRVVNVKFDSAVEDGNTVGTVSETMTTTQLRNSLKTMNDQQKIEDLKALYSQIVQAMRTYIENQKPRALLMTSNDPEVQKRLAQVIPHFASFFGKLGYVAKGTMLSRTYAANN